MRRKHRSNGFILLLVVLMIPLLGMAAIVLTSNSRHIIAQTRRNALTVHAQFACESGIAWIKTHQAESLSANQPHVLSIDHPSIEINCSIELASESDSQTIFVVIGTAKDKRFSKEFSQKHILKN